MYGEDKNEGKRKFFIEICQGEKVKMKERKYSEYWGDGLGIRELAAIAEDRFSCQHQHGRSELPVATGHKAITLFCAPLGSWMHMIQKFMQLHEHIYKVNRQLNLLKEKELKEGKDTRRTVVDINPSV